MQSKYMNIGMTNTFLHYVYIICRNNSYVSMLYRLLIQDCRYRVITSKFGRHSVFPRQRLHWVVYVSVVIQPVQAAVNVSLTTPTAVFGGGAMLTCSWTNLANVTTVEYKLTSTNDVVYTFETISNTNVGSGILSGSVGWMETDTFIVYINVTIQSQFVSYNCLVMGDEGSYQSPSSTLDVGGKYYNTCPMDLNRMNE